jgi:hypothetical protein
MKVDDLGVSPFEESWIFNLVVTDMLLTVKHLQETAPASDSLRPGKNSNN